MEQSADSTGFSLWRAFALGGFAAAAATAIALFGGPSAANADDGSGAPADPGLLGAVTEVVAALEQPIEAVVDVVDVVDTTVIEPVVSAVDETVVSVPVVDVVVEQTLGDAPVSAIVEPVVEVVDQTLSGVGETVGAVVPTVPTVPGIDPALPIEPVAPADSTLSGESSGGAPVAPFGPPTASGASIDAAVASDGYEGFLAGTTPAVADMAGSASVPASPAQLPERLWNDPSWAVTPAGSSSSGSAAGAPAFASDTATMNVLPMLFDDRRGPSSDDALPSSPTFPSDTSPD